MRAYHFTNTNNPIDFPPREHSEVSVDTEDYAIQGQMVKASVVMTDFLSQTTNKDKIKMELAMEIAHKLLDCKFVEFTSQKDIATMDITYRARVFVVPDTQVRILRVMQENNK